MLQIVKAFQFQFESLQASSLCARRELSWATLAFFGCLFLSLEHSGSAVQAQDFLQNFDGQKTSCKVYFDPKNIKLTTHERNQSLAFSGQAAERFQFQAQKDDVSVDIESDIEPTRIFEDLSISIAVFANRPGTQLVARVVFPGQTDPDTRQPLTKLLHGDVLEKATTWQKLSCDTSDENLAKHLVLWRASLIPQVLDLRGMYIDKIYLKQTIGRGLTEILVDDLHVSPVISPAQVELFATEWLRVPKIDFRLDQLLVDGRPIFPVVIPYQHEPIRLFGQLGVNVVWVNDYLKNQELIQQLNLQNIWATAAPPSAKSESGDIIDASTASLLPFKEETLGILFWNLGLRLDPSSPEQLKHWVNQVKTSDREYKRPILADVVGNEALFSRDLDMLGISKHVLQTPYTFSEYADHLQRRMRIAQPGTFVMTWLQTESSFEMKEFRDASHSSPAVVEPEQIRLQTYIALCAGCKGLGYWNWTPLNAQGPGFEERRLVLEQLMLELELLEPFLAGGEVIHRFDVSLTNAAYFSGNDSLGSAGKIPGETSNQESKVSQSKPSPQAVAAVVRSEHGQVILLTSTEDKSQYVPGQMAGENLRLQVRGLPESAFVWEITPTGLWPLETKRITGYTEILLPRFNMTAALLVATDQNVANKMETKVRQIGPRSAELALLLAEEKFARVMDVDEQLTKMGVGISEASHIFSEARQAIDQARKSWTKQQHNQARLSAELASRLMRKLQRAHWEKAITSLSSLTSNPHTMCFQTLPDYWKMIQDLGSRDFEEISLLRSGQFEDPDAMKVDGWTRDASESEDIVVYDALDPSNVHQGEYCLRAVSIPAEGKQFVSINEPAISYTSRQFSLKPGDLLHVSGWVRIPRSIQGSLEGFRIYDTHFGPASALHWSKPTDWQSFELIRPIWKQEDIQIIMELNGLGDVAIDDLKVKIIRFKNPEIIRQTNLENSVKPADKAKSHSNALDFLNRLLK